jgi:hypothetical protein
MKEMADVEDENAGLERGKFEALITKASLEFYDRIC